MGTASGRIVALFAVDELLDGPLSVETGRAPLLSRVAPEIGHPAERQVRDLRPGFQPEDGPGRFRGHLDLPVRVDDRDGVGKAVEGLLGGPLDAEELGLVRPAELPQARGHGVERLGQVPDLVPGVGGHDEVEVAAPDLVRRADEAVDRPQDPTSGEEDENDGQGRPDGQEDVHLPSGGRGAPAGAVVGIAHVLLVQLQDLVGLVLDLAEKGKEPREIGLAPDVRGLGRVR